ncbi:MAG: apolipoprotein N-acyltransferase, partial [Hyphomicrobiales bacterium]|nr:apolipoprotein N-acyltransferase [Hyphomicrobiales bacterium]
AVRAIEEGLPIARSTNTGVSALIDTRGRILAKLGIGERGVLDVRLPPPTPPTVFSRVGDVPMFAGAFLLLLLSMWSKFRKKASA